MYKVEFVNGQIGQKNSIVATDLSREEAMELKRRRNKQLSPGEKSYYGMKYRMVKVA